MSVQTHALPIHPSAYQQFSADLPGQNQAWLQTLRASAAQSFSEHGFPNTSEEEWRYTSLNAFNKALYSPSRSCEFAAEHLAGLTLADTWRVVLLNGRLHAPLSQLADLPAGVSIKSLAQALNEQAADLANYLGQAVSASEHSLIAFNNAWFADGVLIDIAAGCRLNKPIQIIHLLTEASALAATRNIVRVQSGAEAEIIETFSSSAAGLTVAVNEAFLADNAGLRWSKVQLEAENALHFGGTYIRQGRDSRFIHDNFSFGGVLARTDIHSTLDTASACTLNGLFLGSKRQHIDNHTRILHLKPHAVSREFYKGVLDQRARGVFQGRVLVDQQAQKTDSQMNNRNLLLSDQAEVDSKPQLEIYADDVKCAHGVTVGQLDEKAVFFLKSRGLDEASARHILTFAFANEMLEKLENPQLIAFLQNQLYGFFPGLNPIESGDQINSHPLQA